MARGIHIIFTNCTDPARNEEFNRWYTHTCLPDKRASRALSTNLGCIDPKNKPVSRIYEDEKLDGLGCRWAQAASDQEYAERAQTFMEEGAVRQWRWVPLFEAGETFGADAKAASAWDLGKWAFSIQINAIATGKP